MIIRAPRIDGNFYVLDKAISEDNRLSWAARGLLIYLLGKPDHWQVSPAALVNETDDSEKPSGRDAVYALLKELGVRGYLLRHQTRSADGTLGATHYYVSEKPHPEKPETVPHTDKPHTVQPLPANTPQASTDSKQVLTGEQVHDQRKGKRSTKEKSAQIGFDLPTSTFTNLDAIAAMDFKAAYPTVDLDAEINRAAIWLIANPAKRPISNFARFLTSWLSRSQARLDQARLQGITQVTKPVNFYEQRKSFLGALTGKSNQPPPTPQGNVIDV